MSNWVSKTCVFKCACGQDPRDIDNVNSSIVTTESKS